MAGGLVRGAGCGWGWPVRLRERGAAGVMWLAGRVARGAGVRPFPFPWGAASAGARRAVLAGLEDEVEDAGAVFIPKARDDAVDGGTGGFQITGDGGGDAVAIGEENAGAERFRIHDAEAGEGELQALAGGVGVDGVGPLVGDAPDDGDNAALAAHELGGETFPSDVIAAAAHYHVDAELQVIEGGGDDVAVEDATGGGIETEEVEEGLDAPTVGGALDDILAEGAQEVLGLRAGEASELREVGDDFCGGDLSPGAGLGRGLP